MSTLAEKEMDLVPEIVRRKAAEMDAFIKGETAKMTEGAQVASEPQPAPETPPETPAPPKEEPPAPPKATEEPKDEPPKPSTPPPATFENVATEEMTKEERYRMLEGMQKAIGRDLSRVQRENRDLKAELEALRKTPVVPQPTPAAPVGAPTVTTPPTSERRTRLAEALGAENLADLLAEAKEELRREGFVTGNDLKEVKDQVGSVSKTVAMTAAQRFTKDMNDLTQNRWEAINEDPKFIEWMSEEDGYSGQSRRETAQKHYERQDATRLARYFIDYLAQTAPPAAPAAPAPPKLDKRQLASPRGTSAAAPPLSDGPKYVKLSEFTKFAEDYRAGKYSDPSNPERHKQLQQAMFAEQERLDNATRLGHVVAG